MDITITITGIDSFLGSFAAAVGDLETRIDARMQQAGIDTRDEAKRFCPVRTGRLRDSLTYRNMGSMACRVESTLSYSLPVEVGHLTRSSTYVPPQPYLQPAFFAIVPPLIADLKQIAGG